MSMIDRMLAMFGIKTTSISLIGHEREGGYMYLTSPDLPGFTFMLEPGEAKNIRSLINAIEEPLSAYLDAHFRASSQPDHPRLTGFRQSKPMNYVAEVCHA